MRERTPKAWHAAQQNATYSITSLAIESRSGEIFILSAVASSKD
jgi:hypothetical protein